MKDINVEVRQEALKNLSISPETLDKLTNDGTRFNINPGADGEELNAALIDLEHEEVKLITRRV